MSQPTRSGPVIIGFDGSPASERAVEEAGGLLAPRQALVVVVWEAGLAFELIETSMMPPVPIDVRAALEVDEKLYERAQHTAQRGAELARTAGLDAGCLVVADELTPAETLVRVAEEKDACALVVGSHGHKGLSELLLGSTSRDVVRKAPCPVLVVRGPAGENTPQAEQDERVAAGHTGR